MENRNIAQKNIFEKFKWIYFERFFTVVAIITALVTLYFTYQQIKSSNEQVRISTEQIKISNDELRNIKLNQSADLILKFNDILDKKQLIDISWDVVYEKPILKANGGRFADKDLEEYLGIYETMGELYKNGLIAKRMIYNDFSDDIVSAYENKEIRNYIKEQQKDSSDYFVNFVMLAKELNK